MYLSLMDTSQNKNPPLPLAVIHPNLLPLPYGPPRAAASFVEVGIQP